MTLKAHIIHVGNMNNKGTQALFSSDVSVIREIASDASISVSTTDVEGVKKLGLPLTKVLPPMVDIPYDRADQISKSLGLGRSGFSYKWLSIAALLLMPIQTVLTLFSIMLGKMGVKSPYRGEVIDRVKTSNLVISHSDENFKETASSLPLNPYWTLTWWSMLVSRTLEIMVARSFGKPVIMFPNSVGPFRTWIGRFLSRLSLNSCEYVLIRDPISYTIVDKLGIHSPKILTYDTALLFNESGELTTRDFHHPVIGVSPGVYSNSLSKSEVQKYIVGHARALDTAIEKYGFHVIFLPHYISGFSNDDVDFSKFIIEKMKNKPQTRMIITENVAEFKLLLDQMDMVISSKMHPAILAATGHVPVLCVVYDHKQTGFFQRLDMMDCTLDIHDVSYERLWSKINRAWIKRGGLRKSLSLQIPEWQRELRAVFKRVVTPYAD